MVRTLRLSKENEDAWRIFLVLSDLAQTSDFPYEALGFLFGLYLPETDIYKKQIIFEKIILLWKIDREIQGDAEKKISKKHKIQVN